MQQLDAILQRVSRYYGDKIVEHGTTPRGVDWNSSQSQRQRFVQLLQVCDQRTAFTLLDFGCGYGALVDFVEELGVDVDYRGFDIAPEMLEHARAGHAGKLRCSFSNTLSALPASDYAVASGIFNVKLDTAVENWMTYILDTLAVIGSNCARGFAFNMLTSYSEPEKQRPDLFYGDPCFFFDYCRRNFSRNVALLHDYGLYEFTILVRKEPE